MIKITSGTVKQISRLIQDRGYLINVRQMSVVAQVLKYKEYGEPVKVVHLEEETIPDPKGKEVLVKILAAPVNPADINTIQGKKRYQVHDTVSHNVVKISGKYAIKPPLPAVPGNECIAEVIGVGSDVKAVSLGDKITPFARGTGTWRSHCLYSEDDLIVLPKNIGIVEGATINVNPCTAYRMLKDFVQLKPGDTIIQNGANSACGQIAFQLCKEWGVKCVGIVRDRPELFKLIEYLKGLGAAEIMTEQELRTTNLFKSVLMSKPKLALNCVGGKNALEIVRHMEKKSTMVTYGGMSREPLTVPTAALIFNDIRFHGFWMTRWTQENPGSPKRKEMFEDLVNLMIEGKLKAPQHEMIDFRNFKEALENALRIQGFVGKKYILDFSR